MYECHRHRYKVGMYIILVNVSFCVVITPFITFKNQAESKQMALKGVFEENKGYVIAKLNI